MSIGRGPTIAIAREAALKLKETCNLHAEAFSGAESSTDHRPRAVEYPILLLTPTDEARAGMQALASDLRRKHASVFMTGCGTRELPALASDHPDSDAVCLIQSFYGLAIRVGQRRGTDVDVPRHLQKIHGPDERVARHSGRPPFRRHGRSENVAVITAGSRIADIVPRADLPDSSPFAFCPMAHGLRPGSSTFR